VDSRLSVSYADLRPCPAGHGRRISHFPDIFAGIELGGRLRGEPGGVPGRDGGGESHVLPGTGTFLPPCPQEVSPLELAHHPASVAMARHWLAERLRDWPAATVQDALIIGTELVTNAVLHARRPGIIVMCHLTSVGPTIEVRDGSRRPPMFPAENAPAHGNGRGAGSRENGRGLLIVASLALKCGYSVLPNGKSVWAIVRTRHLGGADENAALSPWVGRRGTRPFAGCLDHESLSAMDGSIGAHGPERA
jgi:anti-sigma regulatory factor (Ser/Thr protein kinase)